MDYCACGTPATGRCARNDTEFFCFGHKRTYPSYIAKVLSQAGHGPLTLSRASLPPLQVQAGGGSWTLLCPLCYQDAINQALPEVTAHLLEAEHGSIERVAMRLIRDFGWRDSVNAGHRVGADIITAIAGHRPEWLFNNEIQTLASLYASLARARSLDPPRIRVNHVDERERRVRGLTRKYERIRTVEPLGFIDAWHFDIGQDGVTQTLLVGKYGRTIQLPWGSVVDGVVNITHFLNSADQPDCSDRQRFAATKNTVESDSGHYQTVWSGEYGALIAAVESVIA